MKRGMSFGARLLLISVVAGALLAVAYLAFLSSGLFGPASALQFFSFWFFAALVGALVGLASTAGGLLMHRLTRSSRLQWVFVAMGSFLGAAAVTAGFWLTVRPAAGASWWLAAAVAGTVAGVGSGTCARLSRAPQP